MIKPLIAAALIAAVAAPVAAQDVPPTRVETSGALFGVRESVQQMDISPDGKRVVYVAPEAGRASAVYVAYLAGGVPRLVTRSSGAPEKFRWCRFVNDARLICQIQGSVNRGGILIDYSRLFAIDTDGRHAKELGQERSEYDERLRQFDGDILDWLPDDGNAVLMARDYIPEAGKMGTKMVRKTDGLGVDRIDVTTMATTAVEPPNKLADTFITDGHGTVRIKGYRANRGGTGQLSTREEYLYRLPGAREWLPFSSWDDREGMRPLEVDATTNVAYVLKKLGGRLALYRVKLDGSLASELVHSNPNVDVDDVVRIGRGARVIGVTFAEEKRSVVYFDPEYQKLAAALGRALPNLPMVAYLGSSADNNKLLIRAGSDADPGRYYVFDKANKALNEIMLARPALEAIKLATMKPVSYPAPDGTLIPAYLTLPAGREDARGLPAVVMPHGGPDARDEWGFDWLAQFFAHEGFAVIQPNFRGSAGYGEEWHRDGAFKDWRTAIGDVSAAGQWLVKEGIADPAKLAIVGWSYGGYAALQSGVANPGLFKAIAAIAPVTDLAMLKEDARQYTNWRNVVDAIGAGPHIEQGSPLQNVAAISAPVLLFHGTMDANVALRQSRSMDAKLRSAGKQSELVEFAGLTHSLDDSNARAQMLDRIAAFLKSNTN